MNSVRAPPPNKNTIQFSNNNNSGHICDFAKMRKTMHEDHHKIHPNSTIVVLSNVSLTSAASTTVNNVSIVGNAGTDTKLCDVITNTATSQIDGILADSLKLNLDPSDSPHTTTQYFFSPGTPLVTTSTINQLQSNNNTILIDDTNADIIVCNGDDTLTVSAEPQSLRYVYTCFFFACSLAIWVFSTQNFAKKSYTKLYSFDIYNVVHSTSCSTSTCTTSCSTPYVIFETNTLPYVHRTAITERDVSITRTACIDDSGGGGGAIIGGSSDNIPVDNNNIGDDDTDAAATEHILKRSSVSVLQRRETTTYETVDHVIENEHDDDDEDDTSQGMY